MLGLLYGAGVALAAYAGYQLFGQKHRYVGDLAQKGDLVQVSVNNLAQVNKSVSAANFPAGTDTVLIRVDGAQGDVLQGPIVAYGPRNKEVQLPTAGIGSFLVHRVIVDKVIRNGKSATAATGPGAVFHGYNDNSPFGGEG